MNEELVEGTRRAVGGADSRARAGRQHRRGGCTFGIDGAWDAAHRRAHECGVQWIRSSAGTAYRREKETGVWCGHAKSEQSGAHAQTQFEVQFDE